MKNNIRYEIINKIRTEIEQLHYHPKLDFINNDKVVDMAVEIVDKYMEGERAHE